MMELLSNYIGARDLLAVRIRKFLSTRCGRDCRTVKITVKDVGVGPCEGDNAIAYIPVWFDYVSLVYGIPRTVVRAYRYRPGRPDAMSWLGFYD